MTRRLISSGSSFEAQIGYSRAVVDGDWVFVSGTTGFAYATMSIAEGIVAQIDDAAIARLDALAAQFSAAVTTGSRTEQSEINRAFHQFMYSFCGNAVLEEMIWGLRDRGRFLYLMVGWSAGDWGKLSVGRIMVEELIGEAIAQGDSVFDLTVGGEAYKLDWSDTRMPLLRWERALTWRGHAWLAARRAKAVARRQPWLRRLLRRG